MPWKKLYHTDFFLFHIKIHEISPGAIQKSNGLKVTCLMSLYFKSEEDTMKNEIPATIFLRFFWSEKKKKKKKKLCPHQMTGASLRASRAVTRARQNSNKQSSAYLSLFFFWDGLILCVTLYATKQCWFFTIKTLFLSIIYSITDANNNSPEEMKRKQMNNHPNYNVIVSLH